MSEEELNQELSTDELKDVAGGCASKEWVDPNTEEIITAHVGKEFLKKEISPINKINPDAMRR